MVVIQSATAEIRRGKKIERKKERKIETTGQNIMACPITYGSHNQKKQPQKYTINLG